MSLAQFAIEKRAVTYLSVLLLVVGGAVSYLNLGQLEDPEFTVKTAVITTTYPGASPEEVEQEVTEPLESAIQQLGQLKEVASLSTPGRSTITATARSRTSCTR